MKSKKPTESNNSNGLPIKHSFSLVVLIGFNWFLFTNATFYFYLMKLKSSDFLRNIIKMF